MLTIILPWPPSDLSQNARPHYMKRARVGKAYREACYWQAFQQGIRPNAAYPVPIEVTLEFVRPTRHHHDVANLVGRMKWGLDGLADALGVDDRHFRLGAPTIADTIGGMVRVTLVFQTDKYPTKE